MKYLIFCVNGYKVNTNIKLFTFKTCCILYGGAVFYNSESLIKSLFNNLNSNIIDGIYKVLKYGICNNTLNERLKFHIIILKY